MHLGMTGRFTRRGTAADASRPASFHHARAGAAAHDHVVFHLSNGARVTYQRRPPLRLHGPRAAQRARRRIRHFAGIGIEPLGNELYGRRARRPLRGRPRAPQGGAARPAPDRRPRQHLCLRGAAPGAALARRRRPARSRRGRAADAQRADRLVAGDPRRCSIEAVAAGGSTLRDHRAGRRRARLFPAPLPRSMTGRASPARRRAAAAPCGASCSRAARPSICPRLPALQLDAPPLPSLAQCRATAARATRRRRRHEPTRPSSSRRAAASA